MADDSLLRDIWAQLDAKERMAVRETIYDDGKFNAARFQAKHGGLPSGFRRSTSDRLRLLFVPSHRGGRCAFRNAARTMGYALT